MNFRRVLTYLFIFSLLTVVACKGEKPAEPVGKWIKGSTQTEGQIVGTLELKESSLFVFTAEKQGHSNTNGRYSLSEDHITFEDDSCFSTATYSYNVSETELIFTTITDHCVERVKILEGTWFRSK